MGVRSFPSIESLKAIAEFFGVTIDELLSNRELVHIAEKDGRQKTQYMQDLVFGLMDCCVGMLLFVPFFGQSEGDIIRMVSLLSLNEPSFMIRAVYFAIILLTLVCGVATLALQNCSNIIWTKGKAAVSILLSAIGVIIFMISLEPYAAFFMFALLLVKGILLIKRP